MDDYRRTLKRVGWVLVAVGLAVIVILVVGLAGFTGSGAWGMLMASFENDLFYVRGANKAMEISCEILRNYGRMRG